MSKFADIGLRKAILRAIEENGYSEMTPIQEQAIPIVLAGKDFIGIAQTGTGKTAAFSLPIIQNLLQGEGKRAAKTTRALVLAPTRELAVQISDNIKSYAQYLHFKTSLVYGGASANPQIKSLLRGVDILTATPGRLLDLMNQGHVSLKHVEVLVLDEADRMLDMGFIRDIRKIVERLPTKRQTVLFSATMPKSVENLAGSILKDPVRVDVAPAATTVEKVDQHVLMVPKGRKRSLLEHVLKDQDIKRVLIFTRTKHGANKVTKHLDQLGVNASAIHGNKSQNARQKALGDFRSGAIRALVATDVAARGIDVDGVTHVINFEIPNEPESYVHRIGRTARAGAAGVSLSFVDHEERTYLRDIEKTIRQNIPIMVDHPYHFEGMEARYDADEAKESKSKPRRGAPKRQANSGKHKPNRRINQPKSHGNKSRGGGQRKGRPSGQRSR
jgi:ATP-dependent RNA helicase RhlE